MDMEYHVNHVQDICSPECIPPPDWRQVSGQLLDVVIEERNTLRARLAEVEALCMRSEWAEWPFAKKVLAAARGEGDQ